MIQKLNNKVILITGGSIGLGYISSFLSSKMLTIKVIVNSGKYLFINANKK